MSGTTNYSDVLVKVQKQRKKYAETLDTLYAEIESHSEKVPSIEHSDDLWEYRDRFEEIRGVIYKLKKSANRNCAEIKDGYRDGIRNAMAKANHASGLAFAEREAKYEMQFITEYKILSNLERMVEDLDKFSWYLEGRLRWIQDRQRWLDWRERG